MNRPGPSGLQIMLLCVIGVALMMGFVWTQAATSSRPSAAPENVQSPAPTSAPTELQADDVKAITASDLWQLYDKNEVAAAQEMQGRYVQITGTIKSIDLDAFNNVVVGFSLSNGFAAVRATLQEQDRGSAAKLSKGDPITLLCGKVQRLVGDPYLDSCQICTANDSGLTCS